MRRICIARTMPWQDVCPSVCLSVRHTPVLCLNGNILKVFLTSGSPTILVFPHQTEWKYSDGDPQTGASNARRYEKNHDFQPIFRFIYLGTEARQSHSYYGKRIGNRTQAVKWYEFKWSWVTSNPDFKATIIQRQITRKWYNIELYIQWPTNRKSYMIYRLRYFQWPWTTLPPVSRSRHSLTLNIVTLSCCTASVTWKRGRTL